MSTTGVPVEAAAGVCDDVTIAVDLSDEILAGACVARGRAVATAEGPA